MSRNKQLEAEKELIWLFCFSDADTGNCSNFSAMVSAIILGPSTSGYDDPYSEKVLQSVSRRRIVENAFNQLSTHNKRVLFCVLSGVRISPYVDKVIGKKGAIAYLVMDHEKLHKLCEKVSGGDLTGTDKIAVSSLKVKVEKEYTKAMDLFISKFGKR